MLSPAASLARHRLLRQVVTVAVMLLLTKVFVSILLEYRYYFPADFEAPFLIGRRETFTRFYATAFYTHLISGPLSLILGTYLMWSGGRPKQRAAHRWAGRAQAINIFAALVPSGLGMATQAFAGPIAGVGFATLCIATTLCMLATIYYAIKRRFKLHERWATRCYILLVSPLILRLASGALIVTGFESELGYRLNAWLSWLVPWAIYEVWRHSSDRTALASPRFNLSNSEVSR